MEHPLELQYQWYFWLKSDSTLLVPQGAGIWSFMGDTSGPPGHLRLKSHLRLFVSPVSPCVRPRSYCEPNHPEPQALPPWWLLIVSHCIQASLLPGFRLNHKLHTPVSSLSARPTLELKKAGSMGQGQPGCGSGGSKPLNTWPSERVFLRTGTWKSYSYQRGWIS